MADVVEPLPAASEGPPLESLTVYGEFLLITTEAGETQKDAGLGKVIARGPLVANFISGPVIEIGQDVMYRGGTTIKFGKGDELVFVAMSDVLALVAPAEVEPQT